MNRHKRNHRKIAAVCMATCLAAAASEAGMLTASAAPVGSSYKAGDCNKDGGIDVQDVNMLESWLTGTDTQLNEYGDVDGDGRINAKDLTLLKRKLLEPGDETSDKRVMLVYMCGSDLESGYSEATEDLNEMLKAKYTEDLEVVILTGGASKWNNSYAAADGNYYITIGSEGVKSEKMSGGTHKMSDGNTLKTFISEATAAHPADHYSLVFWDHGSGPLFGLCYDEIAENVLSTTAMYQAIGAAGVHFDWIGFDCCLMGTAEIAYALRNYADYMIGSEESESGLGWAYTNFLGKWAADPTMDTVTLATYIIDDMVSANKRYQCEATLSCLDLSYTETFMDVLYTYMDDVYAMYQSQGISAIKSARANMKDYGDNEFDTVDIKSMADNLKTDHSDALCTALSTFVVYNKTNKIENSNGLALWFFENYPEDGYYYLPDIYKTLGIDSDYISQMKAMCRSALTSTGRAQEVSVRSIAEIIETQTQLQHHLK